MKLSLNWIRDYVSLPEDADLKSLSYDLTMSVVEVEGASDLSQGFGGMVAGEIREIKAHPGADKLMICLTDIGGGEIKEIVCGGSNLRVGAQVAVALPGALVRWHGEGELVEIGETKVRGVSSFGMICGSSEIGLADLFPAKDEKDVLVLSDEDLGFVDLKAGTPLSKALGLEDTILEIDNKSLTNRPDLWGHYGIAREISALYDLPLSEFKPYKPGDFPDFTIEVEDYARCPRYIGVRIEGLSVKASPYLMRSRIWRVGMRPINAMVDITNYVMLSVGQPTHAFDADNIEGHIVVRRAAEGEKLVLLNEKELTLSSDDLVIADLASPVGLAGVMGGGKDSVLPETNKLILEIANFEAKGIRRTASRYELRTEAAIRYEKAIDPERSDAALSLSMSLFKEIYPELKITGFKDLYPEKLKGTEINLSLAWLKRRLGKPIPADFIENKLRRLGFSVTIQGDNAHIKTPSWRSTGDVSIQDDVMEEVARIYGFENFEPVPIVTSFIGAINQIELGLDRAIREYLAYFCGMREIFSYPWVKDERLEAVFPSFEGMLSLAAPPSPDEKYLRTSLIPNLCKAVAENLRFKEEFAIFETAKVMEDKDYSPRFDPRELLPKERKKCAGAFASQSSGGEGDLPKIRALFRRAKGVLEAMPRMVHAHPFEFRKEAKPYWADEVVWLNLYHENQSIGDLALLSKKAALRLGLKSGSAVVFELDVDSILPYPSRSNAYKKIPEYPAADYDVSMLFDSFAKWEDVLKVIREDPQNADLLRDVIFIEEYRGKQIPEGKKSISFRLVIGSLTETLASKEIDALASSIISRLAKSFGATLRS
jgi:phenylalanyl-tRNA synthetase beta chain